MVCSQKGYLGNQNVSPKASLWQLPFRSFIFECWVHIGSIYKIPLWHNSCAWEFKLCTHLDVCIVRVMFMACYAHCFSEVWKQKVAEQSLKRKLSVGVSFKTIMTVNWLCVFVKEATFLIIIIIKNIIIEKEIIIQFYLYSCYKCCVKMLSPF